jgi:hypothetical protein
MFNKGDKVICVVPTFDSQLIKGQVYTVVDSNYNLVYVLGAREFFEHSRFTLATDLIIALN